MLSISPYPTISSLFFRSPSTAPSLAINYPSLLLKSPPCPHPSLSLSLHPTKPHLRLCPKAAASEQEPPAVPEDEWLRKLPEKKKSLYSHSLPCIEAWLRNLGFHQSSEDRAVWFVEKPDWHAQLSLDVTDLYIRYLKSGPGSLEKDVERRFSYALSREDIENAVLGGP